MINVLTDATKLVSMLSGLKSLVGKPGEGPPQVVDIDTVRLAIDMSEQYVTQADRALREKDEQLREAGESVRRANARVHEMETKAAFERIHGARFLRDEHGSVVPVVYCDRCLISVSAPRDESRHLCQPCKWSSQFTRHEMLTFVAEMNGSDPPGPLSPRVYDARPRRMPWSAGR